LARIIVLERDDEARNLNVKTLKEQGHRVVSLTNGEKLIETIERVRPDLVVLGMVPENSMDLVASMFIISRAPVIFERSTGDIDYDAGMRHFYSQALGPDALVEKVDQVLEEHADVHP
jgi:DNA-binding response OmpR family regulator